jgi:hypothetical protein
MLFSNYTIIQAKITIIEKKLAEKTKYVEQYCVMNNSLRCKQIWMEIKALHKASIKLKEKVKSNNN